MIKLYRTWEKVKDLFVKPSLKVYFGKWKNDPNLPMWRNGPAIYLCPRRKLFKCCYFLKQGVLINTGSIKTKFGDREIETKIQEHTHHSLPGNLHAGNYMWNRNIRKKLKKWHLDWIKPVMYLPSWMRFYIVNRDVGWKPKWDYVSYEFPPQFSIIAFGLSLTFTLHDPVPNKYSSDDTYWESILTHLYNNKSGELKETIEHAGMWRRYGEDIYYFHVRPTYIQVEKLNDYYAAISEIRAQHLDETIA